VSNATLLTMLVNLSEPHQLTCRRLLAGQSLDGSRYTAPGPRELT
jgi:hypothetical protein